MKYLIIIIYCGLLLLFVSCFTPCQSVTDRNIVGYYVSGTTRNNGKQFIQVLRNNTFMMVYCAGDSLVTEWGTWKRFNDCFVELDGIRWFNISGLEDSKYPDVGTFRWSRGWLNIGAYDESFQKVRQRPQLICESCNRRR
jgi:hypothetical protein